MNTDLRDLDADRTIVDTLYKIEPQQWTIREESILLDIAASALDEIERLKRLLVWQNPITLKWSARIDCHTSSGAYDAKADAWAEVRKAVMKDV